MTAGSAPDVRYQVFVSSTYVDLRAAREEAIQAILELDCFPAGMELFPASDDEKWDLIRSVVDDSDYYVLIIGGRYGSVDEEGVSYTEREYDYAVASGTPVLAFLHQDPDGLPARDTEKEEAGQLKLEAFREKVAARSICKYWSTATDLGSVLSRSLVKTIKASPGKGWLRADLAMTPEQQLEVEQLRRRVLELEAEQTQLRYEAPDGTDVFAQADDATVLGFGVDARMPGVYSTKYTYEVELSWDEIFAAIGPAMFDEASERALMSLVNDRIRSKGYQQTQKAIAKATKQAIDSVSLSDFQVQQDSFDKIKVQFVALKMIEKSKKRHGVNDKGTYWSLTPYGEGYVMRLKAERRDG